MMSKLRLFIVVLFLSDKQLNRFIVSAFNKLRTSTRLCGGGNKTTRVSQLYAELLSHENSLGVPRRKLEPHTHTTISLALWIRQHKETELQNLITFEIALLKSPPLQRHTHTRYLYPFYSQTLITI